jgi:NhaC family Na+:H+ antiporter
MTEHVSPDRHAVSMAHAAICFAGVIGMIAAGLSLFSVSLHSVIFLCLVWTAANARWLGYSYGEIQRLMSDAISRALPAIYIFLLIGMIIASFIHSGTIATLMYYGLSWLSPALFLPVGLIMCALMSLATGTAWGTVGTLGVVFMAMASVLDLSLGMVAGMIICGATFGDKLSPVSDTTNLAAMSAGTNLYRHIYSMLMTTAPTFLLTLLLFSLLGLNNNIDTLALEQTELIRQTLASHYRLSPWITLLPIIVLFGLSVKRVAAEVTMAVSSLLAVLVAVLYQGQDLALVLNALWENSPGNTGIASLDDLLGRGGMYAMSWTLLLAIMALALGGVMHGAGFLSALLAGLISRVRHRAALVASTIGSGLLGNMAMGEAYISIILNCQLFRDKYRQEALDPALLSRSVEEGATLTTGLIPWTTAGAFYSATLGVAVVDYLPWAFFNYLNALIAIAMAALGLGLLKSSATTNPGTQDSDS